MMRKLLPALLLAASAAFAATAEPAGAPPKEVDPAVAAVLEKDGIRVKDGDKTLMELWFRSSLPAGQNAEDNATIKTATHGTLLGVVRVPERGADRRGQTIKAGLYTMRLSFFPPDGNHQGVAPQRDFILLSLASKDKDPNATPDYKTLTEASTAAAGVPHPLVLSLWNAGKDFKAGLAQEGEGDWVLQHKVGDLPIALIVQGTYAH